MTDRTEEGGGAGRPSGDYAVGYGRPPMAHRFRAGEPSRNPHGRRGKRVPAPSFAEPCDFLDEEVTIGVNGTPVRMTRDAAIDHMLFQQVAKGSVQASRRLDERRAERARWRREDRAGGLDPAAAVGADDEALIAGALQRARRHEPSEDPEHAGQVGAAVGNGEGGHA